MFPSKHEPRPSPLDVGVFSPLKRKWKDILKMWFQESWLQKVSKTAFHFLFFDKLFEEISTKNIIKGFKGSRIYPPNYETVVHRLTFSPDYLIEDLQYIFTVLINGSNVASDELMRSTSQQDIVVSPMQIEKKF